MVGLVTVRVPAGAIVRMSAWELQAIERGARNDWPPDVAVPAPDETSEVGVEVGRPTPARLSAAEKEALKDWAATRGERPKYVTRRRIRDYVVTTGDTTLEHLLEEAAPRRDADRPVPHALGALNEEGDAA